MIISITSPRKGNGQTVLSIMLSALISRDLKQDVCLVDTNKYCDIDFYLSDSLITKGMADFCLMSELGTLDNESFRRSCSKNISENLYICASSANISLDQARANSLMDYLGKNFEHSLIDCLGGVNANSAFFMDAADITVLIIDQSKASIYMLEEYKSFYSSRKSKLLLVVNKYLDSIGGIDAVYNFKKIKKDIRSMGFDVPILKIPFSLQLLNESNENSLLNLIMQDIDPDYIDALKGLTGHFSEKDLFLKSNTRHKRKTLNTLNTLNKILAGEW